MTHDNIDILVVDDDISHCTILQALLRGWGYNVALANSGRQALEQVREQVFDLVLCDVRMAEMDGIATLKEIKTLNPAIPVLIMTAYSSVETAVEALKTGALDYLIKPLDFDNLQATLEKALAHTHSVDAETPAVSASQFGMVGKSPAMQHLLSEIALVAPSEATVLIHGDSGTGKELAAQAIHREFFARRGQRSGKKTPPFVAINCGAITESLLEAELFGYEEGAFTGSRRGGRAGLFEIAHGGTLFLEKIEYLAPELQSALLQVIKQGVLTRLDARRLIPVDVKVIATTTVDLANLVEQNRFSRQLYYALHSFEIVIPPLRARRNSIPSLVHNRLKSLEKRFSSRLKMDDDALAQLVAYSWPGNDFELNSVIENIAISSDNGHIRLSNLPEYLFAERPGADAGSSLLPASLTFSAIEKEAIIHAARVTSGRVQEMAQLLNIGRTTLWRKMKQYDIDAGQFKRGRME